MVLEKAAEAHLDPTCVDWKSTTKSQGGKEYPTYNKK